jgi:putative RNA 2'-phosphotransferase
MKLEDEGYLKVEDLVKNANASGTSIKSEQVQQVVADQEQNLFTLSDEGTRIRIS